MKLLLFILFLVSCGKSPFLNKASSNKTQNTSEQVFSVTFDQGAQQGRDSLGNRVTRSQYNIRGIWQKSVSLDYENKMILIISDNEGNRVDLPFEMDPYLWMPDMGHGSFPITLKKIEIGLYELSEVFFTMGGYWDLHLVFLDEEKNEIKDLKWPLNL